MQPEDPIQDTDISLFAIGYTLLASRKLIGKFVAAGAIIALISTIWLTPRYKASTTFVSSGSQTGNTGFAQASGLAAQLGVTLPTANSQSESPDFYVSLIASRALLEKITRDTIVVRELGGARTTLLKLLEINGTVDSRRTELGVEAIRKMTTSSIDRKTSIVLVEVKSPWPSVSLQLLQHLITGVVEYNQQTRKSQARAEREFLDKRRTIAQDDLRVAENKLEDFLNTNRQFSTSSQLVFENERLKREILLRQQVFVSLSVALEDARLREVRDSPVLTVVEPPQVKAEPEPRGRVVRVLLGILVGGLLGVFASLIRAMITRATTSNLADAADFLSEVESTRSAIQRTLHSLRPGRKEPKHPSSRPPISE